MVALPGLIGEVVVVADPNLQYLGSDTPGCKVQVLIYHLYKWSTIFIHRKEYFLPDSEVSYLDYKKDYILPNSYIACLNYRKEIFSRSHSLRRLELKYQ